MSDGEAWTVKHYQPVTERWHVESDNDNLVWQTDMDTAIRLANGYESAGWDAEAIRVVELGPTEQLPFNGALVLQVPEQATE